MNVKEFTVGVSHTVNLGNYESIRIEASVTLDCEDGDWETTRAEAQIALCDLLDETFKNQASPAWFAQIASKQQRRQS
jgi:hypothetical protein